MGASYPEKGISAPAYLRDIFLLTLAHRDGPWWVGLAATDAAVFPDPRQRMWWSSHSAQERARWLLGQLWHCTDRLPDDGCAALELPLGSSYARAARRLRITLGGPSAPARRE